MPTCTEQQQQNQKTKNRKTHVDVLDARAHDGLDGGVELGDVLRAQLGRPGLDVAVLRGRPRVGALDEREGLDAALPVSFFCVGVCV